MTLVVGLGNPGPEYAATRHNAGFLVVEHFAGTGATWSRAHRGLCTTVEVGTQRVRLVKPETFMNRSGESVAEASMFFKVPAEAVLVVHDELDLPFGQVRLKQGGGHAGHNGLKSVASALGTSEFCRLRVGIGRPGPEFSGAVADYVLSGFAAEELRLLPDVLDEGSQALGLVIRLGLAPAMNQVNRRARAAPSTEPDQND
ncbi:MAG TPA: aminoacyl-tRNA hydrolase [Polyangiaceae bacterium]|nr:aminoacyl-tRNA hydrolase [Polyangiaceae bacterium]